MLDNNLTISEFANILQVVVEPENKITALFLPSYVQRLNRGYRTGTNSLFYLNENACPIIAGAVFDPYHHLINKFNEKISRLFEAGITDHLLEEFGTDKRPEEQIGPEVLTLDHIGIGFKFCAVPLMAAFVVFLLEILVRTVKLSSLHIFNSFIAMMVVIKYLNACTSAH